MDSRFRGNDEEKNFTGARMKLFRYGEPGREKPGLIDANGTLRDLSGVAGDIADRTRQRTGGDTRGDIRGESR